MRRPIRQSAPPRNTAQLMKPGMLIIARSECTYNLWGYLCDRYGVSPADTMQLILEPPRSAAAEMRRANRL